MPTDLLPDRFTVAAALRSAGLQPARAWEVVKLYCSPQCMLAWGQGEEIRCTCRCKEDFGFGNMLHGILRDEEVDCVARPARLEAAPAEGPPAFLDADLRIVREALPAASSA